MSPQAPGLSGVEAAPGELVHGAVLGRASRAVEGAAAGLHAAGAPEAWGAYEVEACWCERVADQIGDSDGMPDGNETVEHLSAMQIKVQAQQPGAQQLHGLQPAAHLPTCSGPPVMPFSTRVPHCLQSWLSRTWTACMASRAASGPHPRQHASLVRPRQRYCSACRTRCTTFCAVR